MPITVGESDIDRIRDIIANWGFVSPISNDPNDHDGAADWHAYGNSLAAKQTELGPSGLGFVAGRVVPTGPVVHPKTVAMLACAYMGQPAG